MTYYVSVLIRTICLFAVTIISIIILNALTFAVPSSLPPPSPTLLFLPLSLAQQDIVPFETRLENQLSSSSSPSSAIEAGTATSTNTNITTTTNTSFANDPSILEMPRNVTVQQIQSNNQTVSQLFNDSILGIEESTKQTRENLSEIRSILK